MDYRMNEFDYDILGLLQNAREGISFTGIVNQMGKSSLNIHNSLNKFRKWNLVSLLDYDHAHYKITEKNKQVIMLEVKCPVCGTTRRVHYENQQRSICINPDCRMPNSQTKQFEIIDRHLLKKGIRKRINQVNEV